MHKDDHNNARLAGNCFAFYEASMTKSEKPTIFRAERSPLKVTLLVFS
ncbi:MAG: GlxA family transcriptional regulator, partial [Mesorhizobium sp.]